MPVIKAHGERENADMQEPIHMCCLQKANYCIAFINIYGGKKENKESIIQRQHAKLHNS